MAGTQCMELGQKHNLMCQKVSKGKLQSTLRWNAKCGVRRDLLMDKVFK